jgi:hypothetical protein
MVYALRNSGRTLLQKKSDAFQLVISDWPYGRDLRERLSKRIPVHSFKC